ncbi:MAG: ABC transporter permease [Corynebacterium sp.]|nr:ABC transporter permease [Corynebacterium sp.]
MLRYLIRKISMWTVMVFVATNATYFLACLFLDPRANFIGRKPPVPPEQITATLRPLNLDPEIPVLERWWTWLTNIVLHWDWGKSPTGVNVSEEFGFRMATSAQLLAGATVISIVVGVAWGVFAASRQYSRADKISQAIAIISLNIHTVVAAAFVILAAIWVNDQAGRRIFFVTGARSMDVQGFFPTLIDIIQHLILPSTALVMVSYAGYYVMQRMLLLDNINADYVRTARAKGLTREHAIRKHALRTSLIPVATSVAFSIPGIFTGAVLTEKIFAWHGMGEYFLQTLAKNDIHGTVAVAAFGAAMTGVGAILSDILVVYLDPRVKVR